MTRGRRALAGLLLGLVAVVLLASPAAAHATLVSVSPTNGATLTAAVAKVTFTFDEDIRSPSTIVITGPDGHRASHGATSVVDNTVSVAATMRPRPQDVGRYVVAYRVVSADGHVVTGESTFQYRPAGVTAAPAHRAATPSTSSGTSHTWWFVGGGLLVVLLAVGLLLPSLRTRQDKRAGT